MKTVKMSLFATALLMVSSMLIAQKGPQKLVMAKINIDQSEQIFLDFKENLKIENWKENYVMAQVSINTNVKNNRVIDQLVTNGRYLIKGFRNENNDLTLHAPNLKKIITVNQKILEEELIVKLFIPNQIKFDYLEEKPIEGVELAVNN